MDFVDKAMEAFWHQRHNEEILDSRARMLSALRAAALECPGDLRSHVLMYYTRKHSNGI